MLKQGKTLKEIAAVLTTRTERQIYCQMNKFINKTTKSNTPWTENELQILRTFLEEGKTITEIQRKMPHRKRGDIYDKIISDKFNSENSLYRPWTSEDERNLRLLIQQGFKHSEIAKETKRTRQSVSTKCFQLKLSQHHIWRSKDDKKLKYLCQNGAVIDDIAKELGVKERTVRYRIEKLKLSVNMAMRFKKNRSLREVCPNKELSNAIIKRIESARKRAIKFSLPFNITREYLLEIFNSQGGKCYYTGKEMKLSGSKAKNTMSLEKKVPSLGYVIGNVAFCCNYINSAKSNLTEREYLELSETICSHRRQQISNIDFEI